MTASNAFKPLSKADLAEVLGVSIRTVENWVNDGTLLPPTKLGNRVYWHPSSFFAWLDKRLSSDAAVADVAPAVAPQEGPAIPVAGASKKSSRAQPVTASTELQKVRNRTQAQLDALMA